MSKMSNDLISRKAVLDILTEERVRNSILASPTFVELLVQRIQKVPAAFDKEKVIEELKTKAEITQKRKEFFIEKGFTQEECLLDGKERAYKNAIEIVEKGGVD